MSALLDVCRTSFPVFDIGRQRIFQRLLRISQGRPLVENTERNSDPAAESVLTGSLLVQGAGIHHQDASAERTVLKR